MWKTSSFSVGGDCVEVDMWRTSSFSAGGDCVEVADTDTVVAVRHSKDPDGAVLHYTRSEWEAFVAGVKNGEFDTPV